MSKIREALDKVNPKPAVNEANKRKMSFDNWVKENKDNWDDRYAAEIKTYLGSDHIELFDTETDNNALDVQSENYKVTKYLMRGMGGAISVGVLNNRKAYMYGDNGYVELGVAI